MGDNVKFLAPWTESTYFDPPAEQSFTGSTSVFMVLPPDPHRVAIIFGVGSGGWSISTLPGVTTTKGIALPTGSLPFRLTEAEFGPLVQQAWYAVAGLTSAVLTVISVSLREFPGDS